ncbi:MAG: RNA polymerase sigma factor [Planctomycetota bacterium]
MASPTATADTDRDRLRIWRYLRALGASATEADDLTQETLLAALRAPRDGVADPEAFVLGIAKNQWLRSRRWWRRRREREIADAVDQLWVATAAQDDGDELIERLRECLGRLQPRARQALELHYRDGLRWQEVGPRIGLQVNGTKTLAQRSRQALRQCIEKNDGSEA